MLKSEHRRYSRSNRLCRQLVKDVSRYVLLDSHRQSYVPTAFAQGTAQTSRTAGISGNIAQERAGNLNFIDQSSAFTSAIGQQNIKAARAQSQAGTYGALAGLAMQGAQSGLFSGSSSAPAAGGVKDPKTGAIMSPNPSNSSNFFS